MPTCYYYISQNQTPPLEQKIKKEMLEINKTNTDDEFTSICQITIMISERLFHKIPVLVSLISN